MKRRNLQKKLAMLILLFLYCFLQLRTTDMTVVSLYRGIPIAGQPFFFLIAFFQISIFTFFIYGTSALYVENYGFLIISRYRSRKVIIGILLSRLLKKLLLMQSIKLLMYTILVALIGQLSLDSIYELLFFFFSDFCIIFVFLSLQILIEIIVSPQLSLLTTQVSYLVMLFLADLGLQYYPDSVINYFILTNYQMTEHLTQLNGSLSCKLIYLFCNVAIAIFMIYKLGQYFFNKKDIF